MPNDLLSPVDAIAFALQIDDHFEMRDFLLSWQHGDTGEWNADIAAWKEQRFKEDEWPEEVDLNTRI